MKLCEDCGKLKVKKPNALNLWLCPKCDKALADSFEYVNKNRASTEP